MNIQGKLHKKYDLQQVSASFKKREFVVEYVENPLYPQYVKFQLIQDRCDLLEPVNEGETVEVSFNLRGREWTAPDGEVKYFNSLDAWRVQKVEVAGAAGANTGAEPVFDTASVGADDADDLPF